MTYEEAEDLFSTAKDTSRGKPIANNTRLYHLHGESPDKDEYLIRLHNTFVVTMFRDREDTNYSINSGGWHTVTTKQRINKYVPNIRLYTVKGTLKVAYGWDGSKYAGECLFHDGLVFNSKGMPAVDNREYEEA